MKKRLLVSLAILLLLGVAVWFWMFQMAGRYELGQGVPADAVFVVKTPSFNAIHESLRRNRIWKSLKEYPSFQSYQSTLNAADSICDAHPMLKKLLTDRPFAVSCHRVSASKYDYLYVCDLGKLNVIRTLDGALASWLGDCSLRMQRKGEVTELKIDSLTVFYGIRANLLLASLSEKLVQKALADCGNETGTAGRRGSGDVVLDLDHHRLDGFFESFSGMPGNAEDSSALQTTRLVLDLTDEALVFQGETLPNRKKFSLLSALNLMNGARSQVKHIAGSHTAAYVSLCFDSFSELEAILLENYKADNLKEYLEYERSVNRLDKFLGVNVVELFTSWIGNEIVFIKPEVEQERRLDNVVVAIHSKDIDLAKDQMAYLTEQVERKTPVRFKAIQYNGHTIHFLSLKGFFNMFLGGWFKKLERPYYTFLGDYVVFSNSSATLATMIKEFSLGNTLANDEKYNALMNRFGHGNSVYGYINSPGTYEYLYNFLKPEERKELAGNKGAFESFERIGFGLANAGSGFETRIIACHNVNASEEYRVRELNSRLEDLADRIESGYYYPVIPDSVAVSTRGQYSYRTQDLVLDGRLSNGNPDGIWNIRDPERRPVGQFTYRDGIRQGDASFFYPDGAARARLLYEKDKIVAYREFFPDGTLKMEVEYNKGLRHGNAKFYYSTGHLQGEGKYRKGKRTGTWKYYRVTGELERKMKF